MNTPTPQPNSMEERFDAIFEIQEMIIKEKGRATIKIRPSFQPQEDMQNFIRSEITLAEQKAYWNGVKVMEQEIIIAERHAKRKLFAEILFEISAYPKKTRSIMPDGKFPVAFFGAEVPDHLVWKIYEMGMKDAYKIIANLKRNML